MSILDDNNYIDHKSVSVMSVAQKYGLIGGAALIVLGLVFYLTGMVDYTQNSSNTLSTILQYFVMGGAAFFAMNEHRDKELGGYMPYGRALGVGSMTGVIMGIILGIWSYIFFAFVAPDLVNQMITAAEETMAEKGIDEEQMEFALSMTKKMMSPVGLAIITAIGTAISVFFISLIVGFFAKKDVPRA